MAPTPLFATLQRITTTGSITLADRHHLLAAMYDSNLGGAERTHLHQVLQGACQGRYRPVM